MSRPYRALVKDVVVYGLGDLLVKASVLVTHPIYTRIFTPRDYGIWSFVNAAVALLAGVLLMGGYSAYARFFLEADSREQRQLVTSTWFATTAFWTSGAVLLLVPLSPLISRWFFGTADYSSLWAVALLTIPLSLINALCGQVLRNELRPQPATVLNGATTLLSVVFSLFATVVLRRGLVGMQEGILAAAIVMLPVRLWTVRDMLRPVFSRRLLRRMLAFGVPLVPMTIAYWIFDSSDRFVLGHLSTLDQLGLYAIANNLTTVLALANAALAQAWMPRFMHAYQQNPAEAPAFYGRVMTYILVGFGLCAVALSAFATEALKILSTPAFYPAARGIAPLSLSVVAYASTQVTGLGITLKNQTRFFGVLSSLAAALNLALNLLFVPAWGMMASSWATAASYTFLSVAYLVVSQRLLPVVYEKRRSGTVLLLTIVFTMAASFLPDVGFVRGVALKTGYCLSYVALLFALAVLDRREWEAARGFLQSLRAARIGAAA
jgi:O-antigen/teichoic acid export membrane protein